MIGSFEKWDSKNNYNLFKRKNNEWIIEGPPITFTDEDMNRMNSIDNKTNISERFK